MPDLILIPCSASKSTVNTHAVIPAGAPDILNILSPPFNITLTNMRNTLMPFANIDSGGFSIAFERYRGEHSWQYKFPLANWRLRPTNPTSHVIIVSALYGLLMPKSFIPYYNLKMKDRLPGFGRTIKSFWQQNNFLHNALLNYYVINGITSIHNLLTKDYQEAVQLNALPPV